MSTILVVDDEPGIRRVLVSFLRASGHVAVEAADGREALERFRAGPPDLVLLDIGLPDVDGLEVLRQMRMVADVPTLLVTARAEEMDKIIGLSVGADDYVTKPFSPREVVARVAAVLRRTAPVAATTPVTAAPPLRFHGLTIDPRRREVAQGDVPVQLSALERSAHRLTDSVPSLKQNTKVLPSATLTAVILPWRASASKVSVSMTSAVIAVSVASGICLEAQAALPSVL